MIFDKSDTLKLAELLIEQRSCSCGWSYSYPSLDSSQHAKQHLQWALGLTLPSNLFWRQWNTLVLVSGESPIAEKRVAYKLAVLMRVEEGYDFPLLPSPDGWAKYWKQPRAYLALWQERAISLAIVGKVSKWGWDKVDSEGLIHFDQSSPCPALAGIFVCGNYRRKGIGKRFVEMVAEKEGIPAVNFAWSLPLSKAGHALALAIAGEELHLCGSVPYE